MHSVTNTVFTNLFWNRGCLFGLHTLNDFVHQVFHFFVSGDRPAHAVLEFGSGQPTASCKVQGLCHVQSQTESCGSGSQGPSLEVRKLAFPPDLHVIRTHATT